MDYQPRSKRKLTVAAGQTHQPNQQSQPMKDLTTTTDLPTLAQHIIRTHQQVEDSKNQAILHAITCGSALIEAKHLCQYGDWLNWLANHCQLSHRTAQLYMKLAKHYPTLEQAKTQRATHLSLREAVKQLASPKAPATPDNGWLPNDDTLLYCHFNPTETLLIQQSDSPGYYHAAYLGPSHLDYIAKAIRHDYVAYIIFDWLPGKHTRHCTIQQLNWQPIHGQPDFVKQLTQSHWPDPH